MAPVLKTGNLQGFVGSNPTPSANPLRVGNLLNWIPKNPTVLEFRMLAIVIPRYGNPDALQLVSIRKPVPRPSQILINVKATSINPIDWKLRQGQWPLRAIFGLRNPRKRISGMDFAGVVTHIGRDVHRFQVGDSVFGANPKGTTCEYIAVDQNSAVIKSPPQLEMREAAGIPLAGLTALQALRKGKARGGTQLLVYGASGGVGSFAVQIGRAMGCQITTMCSARNLSWMTSLGSDEVLDYAENLPMSEDRRFDLVLDTVGKTGYARWKRHLTPKGMYITASPRFADLFSIVISRVIHSTRAKTLVTHFSQDDLHILGRFAEDGHLWTRIDREYRLSDVAEAHRYAEQGHTAGKVILTL